MQARVLRVDWPAGQLPSLGEKMAAAREARYDLLLRACGEARRGALLLAHHADDQVETFLLRLMHASGVLGLACMPPSADKRTGAWGSIPQHCTASTALRAVPLLLSWCACVHITLAGPATSPLPGAASLTRSTPVSPCSELGRVRVVRPLLDFRKAELEEYCHQRGLDHVVDPTNAELSFHR